MTMIRSFFGNITPDGGLAPWDGTNRYNYAPVNHFLRPIEQWSVGAFAEYELNEHFTPYFETMFASNTVSRTNRGIQARSS